MANNQLPSYSNFVSTCEKILKDQIDNRSEFFIVVCGHDDANRVNEMFHEAMRNKVLSSVGITDTKDPLAELNKPNING